jgi:hypothetical protein
MSKKTEVEGSAAAGSRRKFLKGAVAVGAGAAATVAAPAVHAQAPVKMKFQSTWPNKDIFHEFAQDFVKRVNEMAGGRLELELLCVRRRVPAFQLIDAVHAGILDGGHGVAATGTARTRPSRSSAPPPPSAERQPALGWINYGGGQQLYNELVQQCSSSTGGLPVRTDAEPAHGLVQEGDQRRGRPQELSTGRWASPPTSAGSSGSRSPSCPAARSCRPSTGA